jgi:hypothetical protein
MPTLSKIVLIEKEEKAQCRKLKRKTKKRFKELEKNYTPIVKKIRSTSKARKMKKCQAFCKTDYVPSVLEKYEKEKENDKEKNLLTCHSPVLEIEKRLMNQECEYYYCNNKCRGFPRYDVVGPKIDRKFQKHLVDNFVILDKDYNPRDYKNPKKEMKRLGKTLKKKGVISHCKMTEYDDSI